MTTIQCAACGGSHHAGAWETMAIVETLTAHEVRAHALVWPADAVVEVRSCARCAHPIARTMRRTAMVR